MKRILTLCPSRGRPDKLARMYASFKATSTESDIIIRLDDDDPDLDTYKHLGIFETMIGPRMTITQILNDLFSMYSDYDFYHITNDDVIYRTDAWDKRFIEILRRKNGGIAFGNDYLCYGALCVHPCISGNIVRILGWVQLPGLTHLYGDTAWMWIGHNLNKLFYCADVVIEHMHWNNRKAEIDESYKRTNSKEMFQRDEKIFNEWKEKKSAGEIKMLRDGLGL